MPTPVVRTGRTQAARLPTPVTLPDLARPMREHRPAPRLIPPSPILLRQFRLLLIQSLPSHRDPNLRAAAVRIRVNAQKTLVAGFPTTREIAAKNGDGRRTLRDRRMTAAREMSVRRETNVLHHETTARHRGTIRHHREMTVLHLETIVPRETNARREMSGHRVTSVRRETNVLRRVIARTVHRMTRRVARGPGRGRGGEPSCFAPGVRHPLLLRASS